MKETKKYISNFDLDVNQSFCCCVLLTKKKIAKIHGKSKKNYDTIIISVWYAGNMFHKILQECLLTINIKNLFIYLLQSKHTLVYVCET